MIEHFGKQIQESRRNGAKGDVLLFFLHRNEPNGSPRVIRIPLSQLHTVSHLTFNGMSLGGNLPEFIGKLDDEDQT
jgi:hypothetical protein